MLRKVFGYSILLVTLLWLVLSYVPASVVTIPQIAYPMGDSGRPVSVFLIVGFAVFVLLQVWLVVASVRMFRSANGSENETAARFGLTRTAEAFWTAIPLLMTLGLALAVLQVWSGS